MDLRNRIEDWLAHLYVIEEKSRQIPLKGVPMGARTHSLTNDCNTWKVYGCTTGRLSLQHFIQRDIQREWAAWKTWNAKAMTFTSL